MSLEHLVAAAIVYHGDEETSDYRLRAATRLRGGQADGFVQIDGAGSPLHFAWVAPFVEFYCAEVSSKLEASLESVLLLIAGLRMPCADAGTMNKPSRQLAKLCRPEARAVIFGASNNVASLKGNRKSWISAPTQARAEVPLCLAKK